MKNIVIIFGFLAILCFAWLGLTYIFEVRTFDETFSLLLKIEGALLFLGICTALVHKLFDSAKS